MSSITQSAIVCTAKRGTRVEVGDQLAVVHARTEAGADEAARSVLAAYRFADEPPAERPVLLDVVT